MKLPFVSEAQNLTIYMTADEGVKIYVDKSV